VKLKTIDCQKCGQLFGGIDARGERRELKRKESSNFCTKCHFQKYGDRQKKYRKKKGKEKGNE
jgi:hypothetical protein